MRIAFFDSGVGGLTVLREALKLLPRENYIYYADALNAPYGTKSKDEVRLIVKKAVEFLNARGIKALVVACNTATSIAIDDLRASFKFPVIGMEPAVKPAVEKNNGHGKRVLVVATPLTLREEKFHNLVSRVDTQHIVDYLPMPELVLFAEKMIFDGEEVSDYIREQLSAFDLKNYGTLVLGCTHFPYFRKVFESIIPPGMDIIDGNYSTVRHMKNVLENNGLLDGKGCGDIEFFVSSRPADEETVRKFKKLLETN